MLLAGPELPSTDTFNVRGVPEPHELFAVTEIFPLFAPGVAVIDVEPELPLHPDGNVHVYDVAPDTAVILYVWEVPWHTAVVPVIAPGCAGVAVNRYVQCTRGA